VSSTPSASSPPLAVKSACRPSPAPPEWTGHSSTATTTCAQIHARAAAPSASPASAAASRQSLLAGLANLQEHNQRLRRQNHRLTARLSEVLGTEVFHESGIEHPGETGQLRTRVTELEQLTRDLRQQLEERDRRTRRRACSQPRPHRPRQPETGWARVVHYTCCTARRLHTSA